MPMMMVMMIVVLQDDDKGLKIWTVEITELKIYQNDKKMFLTITEPAAPFTVRLHIILPLTSSAVSISGPSRTLIVIVLTTC